MVDVSKVEGPSGPPESSGKKDKGSVDAEKFKEAMRRRVTEVSQVDPDEQKKRKRREEAEEEPLEEASQSPATPASQVAPFSMKEEQKKVSPMEKQGPGISPTESSQKATLPSPPSTPFFQTPSTDEMADDSGVLEEESFIETIPSPPQGTAPPLSEQPSAQVPSQPQQFPSPSAEEIAPTIEQPIVAGPPETRTQQPPSQRPTQKPSVGPPPEKKPSAAGMEPHLTGLKAKQQKQAAPAHPSARPEKGTTAEEMEGVVPSKAETAGFFEQLGKGGEGEKEDKKTAEELEREAEIQEAAAGQPSPFASTLEEKGEKKIEKKEAPAEMAARTSSGGELPVPVVPPSPEALPSYVNIHPQVMEIFDRMVGVMTVMSMSGMTETVMTLNAPQFASSVFFGSQIIIQEFSTAPQAFNIQLNGTPQAVALFQGNIDDLMAAFQAGNYNFRVNRLETGYLTERPLFKRKEKAGEKEKDTGENRQ